jgi:hypothetical protein
MWKAAGLAITFILLTGSALGDEESSTTHLVITIGGPAVARTGENVRITVTLSNPTAVPLVWVISPGPAEKGGTDFEVQGPHGLRPPTAYNLALDGKANKVSNFNARHLTLMQQGVDPGESRQQYTYINKLYDMTARGKYIIQALRHLPDGAMIRSNKIAVTVE